MLAHFDECLADDYELAGFCIGCVSVAFWMGAQIPQIWGNYQRKTGMALSLPFILAWLGGDVLNFAGCLLTQQLPTQTFTAMYFCALDLVLLSQMVFYSHFKPRHMARSATAKMFLNGVLLPACLLGSVSLAASASSAAVSRRAPGAGATGTLDTFRPRAGGRAGRSLLAHNSFMVGAKEISGYVLGCLSMVLYVSGRVSQIRRNSRRKSTKGLSVIMFMMAIGGSASYIAGICLEGMRKQSLLEHLPWLAGSTIIMVGSAADVSPAPHVRCRCSGGGDFFGWLVGKGGETGGAWRMHDGCTVLLLTDSSKRLCSSRALVCVRARVHVRDRPST